MCQPKIVKGKTSVSAMDSEVPLSQRDPNGSEKDLKGTIQNVICQREIRLVAKS